MAVPNGRIVPERRKERKDMYRFIDLSSFGGGHVVSVLIIGVLSIQDYSSIKPVYLPIDHSITRFPRTVHTPLRVRVRDRVRVPTDCAYATEG